MERKYTIIAYSEEKMRTTTAVGQSIKHAVKLADLLLKDGYGAVEIRVEEENSKNDGKWDA